MNRLCIKDCPIYRDIQDARDKHGRRLTFNLSAYEILQLLGEQPENQELQQLISRQLKEAEDKVDKRGIDKQREIRDKYQGTHGIILKNIPAKVERQVVYNAIVKLGNMTNARQYQMQNQSQNQNHHHDYRKQHNYRFEGELKMRSFQYPKKKKNQNSRIAFPIFVKQRDRDDLLKMSDQQNGELRLPVENNREYNFSKDDWDGVVQVEKVKNRDGEGHHDGYTSGESDFQEMGRGDMGRPLDNGDGAFSNISVGSSNRLFQTPNPCQTPNPMCLPLNVHTTIPQHFSQPPSPFSTSSFASLPASNHIQAAVQNQLPQFSPVSPQQQVYPMPQQNYQAPQQNYQPPQPNYQQKQVHQQSLNYHQPQPQYDQAQFQQSPFQQTQIQQNQFQQTQYQPSIYQQSHCSQQSQNAQINPRLEQATFEQNNLTTGVTGTQFVRQHGHNMKNTAQQVISGVGNNQTVQNQNFQNSNVQTPSLLTFRNNSVQNLLIQNLPVQNLPVQNLPGQNLPVQNLPIQNLPLQNLPLEKSSVQNSPGITPGIIKASQGPMENFENSLSRTSDLEKSVELEKSDEISLSAHSDDVE